MTVFIFQFFNNDYDFPEKLLIIMNIVLVHHFGEFTTHQMQGFFYRVYLFPKNNYSKFQANLEEKVFIEVYF